MIQIHDNGSYYIYTAFITSLTLLLGIFAMNTVFFFFLSGGYYYLNRLNRFPAQGLCDCIREYIILFVQMKGFPVWCEVMFVSQLHIVKRQKIYY